MEKEHEEVKVRYSLEELNEIRKKAKESKKSLSDYQKELTKNSEVKIIVKNGK